MEPPIPSGTILQNRYHLLSILGQGGFGRTYLAQDQGRVNEPCALKELIPSDAGVYALEKSKELFQREAETLYKIKHPQVPQFRANFEQDGRLFLVQDYVEGKTYRQLLNERKAQTYIQTPNPNLGQPAPARNTPSHAGVFSEAEVRQLLKQLLPVLDHLHSKNIIHRDITPDNIIRQNADNMPVLIDFGVVKELATRFYSPNISAPVTTVGKVGYAPSEQIQTGRAYPSSDLYSLAVTVVVLLTGKEPQELFDDNQLIWNWQRWVNTSHEFAQILNRMLSYRPGDRYQSAREVLQALESPVPTPAHQQPIPTQSPLQRPDPNASQVATMAVGRRPDPEASRPTVTPGRPNAVIPEPTSESIWDNPWAVVGIGALLALVAGLGSWMLVSSLNRPSDPQASITPTATFSETPSPTTSETPTPTPTESTSFSQRLNLAAGQTVSRAGNLKANTTIDYTLRGQQDQRLTAYLTGEGVLMNVLGPDQNPVGNRSRRVQQWEGALPFNGDYTIQLSPVQGLKDSDYSLTVALANPASPTTPPTIVPTTSPTISPTTPPTTAPTTSPSTPPTQTFELERLTFDAGQQVGQFAPKGRTSPQKIKRYVVNLQNGQTLAANVQTGDVSLEISSANAPNGQFLPNGSGVKFWTAPGPLPAGEYRIDVRASQEADFALTVDVANSP